jgi:hypothetical protein
LAAERAIGAGYDAGMERGGVTRRGAAAAVLVSAALFGAGWAADPPSSLASVSAARAATQTGRAATRQAIAARYLAIAEAGNRRLEADFDPLEGRGRNNLTRAQADLRDAAATERLFDRRLRQIRFPPETEQVAQQLYRVNQARATLTAAAAVATSLRWLHSYEPALDAANGPVEQAVRTIRRLLGLPPPETS